MSENFDFDLFVIGAGSGGVRAARWSAGLGAKVAICEEYRYGGTCVIRGCVPKKLMLYASEVSHEMKIAQSFGWSIGESQFNWKALKQNRDKEVQRLSDIYRTLLKNKNVEMIDGRGVITGPHEVSIGTQTFSAKKILIATGASPYTPLVEGGEFIKNSNDVFLMENRPSKVLIVGGGYIAVEFAGIFKGLGSDVSIAIRSEKILNGFDDEVRCFVATAMEKKEIRFLRETKVKKITKGAKGFDVDFGNSTENYDLVFYATGRHPNTKNLGLEELGIEMGKNGKIIVDEKFQTNISSIYALGDCIDRMALTPIATTEGTLLAEHLFNKKPLRMDYSAVPSAVFSQPCLAVVGPTEEEARKKYSEIDVYTSEFRALKYTLSDINERTFMKMIVETSSQKVVSLQMVGKDAAEIIQLGGVCVKAGLTKEAFDQTIGIHPSSAEEFVTMREKRAP